MATHGMKVSSILRIAGVYVGSVVGAGFASGREIWSFFARFGSFGLIGIAAASLLFCILAPLLMRTMQTHGISQYGDMYRRYLTPKVASILDSATTVYLFCVLSVMFAGSTSLVGGVLGLGSFWSAVLSALFLVALAVMGLDWVASASSLLSPVLVVGICLLCVERIFAGPIAPSASAGPGSVTYRLVGSSVSSLIYVSYNMLLCIGVFASLASSRHTMVELIGGGILGGAVLGIMALLVLVTLATEPVAAATADMPLLLFARRRGGLTYVLYLAAVWAAMVTTALSMLLSLMSRLGVPLIAQLHRNHRGRGAGKCWLGPALVVLCVPISYVGFGMLVDRVYLLFGLVGFLILALILRSSYAFR